jgi:prolyl-tRNA editing enzyme YbaK/EbsC (Cys-tRNA(Pro) deacylase)
MDPSFRFDGSQNVSLAQQIDPFNSGPVHAGADISEASPATRRVLDAMTRDGIPFSLKMLPEDVRTPEAIADACGCDIDVIAQSTILRGKATKKSFLLIYSPISKLNDRHLGTIVGENLQRADAEFTLRFSGYPIHSIPPMPHLNRMAVMLDSSLMRFARIWCPSGAPNAVISVPILVLARAISARIVRLET